MNEIKRWRMVIEFDVWSAQQKQSMAEIDSLIFDLRDKRLLGSCGNVKSTLLEGPA